MQWIFHSSPNTRFPEIVINSACMRVVVAQFNSKPNIISMFSLKENILKPKFHCKIKFFFSGFQPMVRHRRLAMVMALWRANDASADHLAQVPQSIWCKRASSCHCTLLKIRMFDQNNCLKKLKNEKAKLCFSRY